MRLLKRITGVVLILSALIVLGANLHIGLAGDMATYPDDTYMKVVKTKKALIVVAQIMTLLMPQHEQ